MTRIEFLVAGQTKEVTNVTNSKIVAKEKRSFEKQLSDLRFKLSDEKEKFEERLSSEAELTWDVVKLDRTKIKNAEAEIKSLEEFITEFYA